MFRRLLPAWAALLASAGLAVPAAACPFCSMQGQTLTGEVNQASMVLFGTLTNAQLGAGGAGTTDFRVEAVVKNNPILGGKKVVTLPRYVPTDNNQNKYLMFCDVYKGKIDPYRGVPVKGVSDIVKYLQGALAVKDKDISTRLRFFFDYLDNADLEIANDSYKEFGNASYADYAGMAHKLPADRIAKWLQDPDTPSFRFGLYASMLGHCGTAKHARLLRHMLEEGLKKDGAKAEAPSPRRITSGLDGVLAGYTMLAPKEGWAYVQGLLKDASQEFMVRYAALRAVRFFWDNRPDLIAKKDLVAGACLLLDQGDIADLAIEDLRKWGSWDVSDRVLGLYGKKSHDVPVVRRSILRYALSCPKSQASAFVEEQRKKDPEMVKDVEELLKLENTAPAPKPVASK